MISGLVAGGGHTLVGDERDADVNVIVTCSVKDATASRMVHRMKTLSASPLVIAGCLAEAEPATVRRFAPRASLMGPGSIPRVLEAVDGALRGERAELLGGGAQRIGLPKIRINPAVGIVEIASGCKSECSFCQTKLAKGGLESYRIGDIVRQVRAEVRDGCSEVWLSSTDNGCYGLDIGSTLPDLLGALRGVRGDFGVRVGMMNPMYMPRILGGLLDAFAADERLYRFLHVPVQSGSDAVLAHMRRGHTAGTFRDACARFRGRFGAFTVATDVIVGYPAESPSDFERTLRLLEEARPDVINISRYSARPGTDAAGMEQVPAGEARRRSREAHDTAGRISLARNEELVGSVCRARFTERSARGVVGRTRGYKQVSLDGARQAALGEVLDVRITGATAHGLSGLAD